MRGQASTILTANICLRILWRLGRDKCEENYQPARIMKDGRQDTTDTLYTQKHSQTQSDQRMTTRLNFEVKKKMETKIACINR